jgi:hypothetical protein
MAGEDPSDRFVILAEETGVGEEVTDLEGEGEGVPHQ